MNYENVMTPGEVSRLFRVNARTVTRWANSGKLPSFRTIGGHRRFPRATVEALAQVRNGPQDADSP